MHPIGSYIGIETTPLDHPHTEAGDAIAFEGQKRVLGMLASGRPADDILAELCRGAEALNPGASAAILVLNRERKCLDRAIAPSASLAFAAALSNIPVGPPHLGTCAAAVFRGEVITCTNVATDARWDPIWTKLYLDYGIQASQSTPIFGSDGLALGTLVLSFPEPQEPDAWNPATIRLSVELASLALERMRALDDLRELNRALEDRVEERTRERDLLWQISEDLLVVADYEGRLLQVSPSWTRVLGHDEETLLSTPYTEIIDPDDLNGFMETLRNMRRASQPVRYENRVRAADGSWRTIAWTLSPDPTGDRLHGVGRDVTAEKLAAEELARTEAQLRQALKMEAVGQLTGGVAHDFNNILSAVLGNLELLEQGLTNERLLKLVQAATRAAGRGAKLTEQLLVFSRKHHLKSEPVDLNAAVEATSDMLRRTLGGATEVKSMLALDLWRCLVDPTQLELAIINLAINARDAMVLGGAIQIATWNVKASDTNKPADLSPGDYVAFSVSDNGSGMNEQTLSKVFDPFFTTKEPGKGTGLGLSQVYGFTKQSGGDIRIKSTPGRGTTVEVFLPRAIARGSAGHLATISSEIASEVSHATIMIVDDQDDVREVLVAFLGDLGYTTIPVASGRAAVDLLNSDKAESVDLLLVDYAMPGINGVEVAQAARAKRPDLPVVVVTGYVDTSRRAALIEGAVLLRKPFQMKDLATAIATATARGSRPPANIISMHTARI